MIDIAPFLQQGDNVIAALVFNMGADKPMAFISAQTAFLFRSQDPSYAFLNSDQNWKTLQNQAYDPIGYQELKTYEWVRGYYACGPGDEVFADRYPWGWETIGFDDTDWKDPAILIFDRKPPWHLVPRNIAFMDTHREKPARIRRHTGLNIPRDFAEGKLSFSIPANLESEYSGYPYAEMATFLSSDARLNEIFEMGLHTLRMCSGETFYDTPFYEQLSYAGDNRPIAGNYLYNTTDDRLLREVIRLLPQSVITHSAMLSLDYAHTLDCAAQLYRRIGQSEKAAHWEQVAARIKTAVYVHCWDEEKQLFADYPDKQQFSQHTNILAILCDVIAPAMQESLLERILAYDQFDEVASSYFSFFLFKSMQKVGREDLFLQHLDFWVQFVEKGFTTFGETGFASHDRSDCHAWSAHPSYFLLNSVCGIKPGDIGFQTVKISPHLGELTEVTATMPHLKGRIGVTYKMVQDKLSAEINLPPGLSGKFEYTGKTFPLQAGKNYIEVEKITFKE